MGKSLISIFLLIACVAVLFGCTDTPTPDSNNGILPSGGVNDANNEGLGSGAGAKGNTDLATGKCDLNEFGTPIHQKINATNYGIDNVPVVMEFETWSKNVNGIYHVRSIGGEVDTIQVTNFSNGDQISYIKGAPVGSPDVYIRSATIIPPEDLSNANKVNSNTESVFNSLINSNCTCKADPSLYSGEKGNFGGLECQYLKKPIIIDDNRSIIDWMRYEYDCINLDFCEALVEKTYQNGVLINKIEINSISRDVSDSVVAEPTNYTAMPTFDENMN